MGLFKKIPNLKSKGKPVWKHVSVTYYLFFNNLKTWLIGNDYEKDVGYIQSIPLGEIDFNKTQWSFLKNNNGIYEFSTDDSLSLIEGHPSYPDMVLVSQKDADSKNPFAGSYERVKNKKYIYKPYFQSEDNFVFCDQEQWFVGKRLGDTKSKKVYSWVYSDDSSIWPNNNTLHIVDYTETLNISSAGAAQKLYPEMMGIYNLVPGVIYSGRPVWKHSSNNLAYLYYVWEWGIGSTVGDLSAKIFTYYDPRYEIKIPETGWVYFNNSIQYNDTTLIVKPRMILHLRPHNFIK